MLILKHGADITFGRPA